MAHSIRAFFQKRPYIASDFKQLQDQYFEDFKNHINKSFENNAILKSLASDYFSHYYLKNKNRWGQESTDWLYPIHDSFLEMAQLCTENLPEEELNKKITAFQQAFEHFKQLYVPLKKYTDKQQKADDVFYFATNCIEKLHECLCMGSYKESSLIGLLILLCLLGIGEIFLLTLLIATIFSVYYGSKMSKHSRLIDAAHEFPEKSFFHRNPLVKNYLKEILGEIGEIRKKTHRYEYTSDKKFIRSACRSILKFKIKLSEEDIEAIKKYLSEKDFNHYSSYPDDSPVKYFTPCIIKKELTDGVTENKIKLNESTAQEMYQKSSKQKQQSMLVYLMCINHFKNIFNTTLKQPVAIPKPIFQGIGFTLFKYKAIPENIKMELAKLNKK